LLTGLRKVREELPGPPLNGSLNREARKHSHKLQLHLNLSLSLGHRMEVYSGLQRDTSKMAQEVCSAVGFEAHQQLIHGAADGVIGFNL
jgi:hypothetical protein